MSFIYNLILILLLISSLYEMYGNSEGKANKTWFYSIVTLMIFTAGLAYGLSPDWIPYWNAFEGVAGTNFSGLGDLAERLDMEYGYILLNKAVSSIGLGYASFTLIIAAIALYLKASTIYKYGGYVFLSLLMYYIPVYFFEEHVHVRQGIANAIMIFSIRYIIERKLYKFLICFVIAFLFHKAVVAFLFAYWIVKIKFNNTAIIGIVGLAVVGNYVGLSSAIDGIMQFMPFGVAETYNDYANAFSEGGILGDIVKILTVLAIVMFNKPAEENDEYYAYFRNIYIFGVIIYFFFGKGIFAARLPVFFTVYLAFIVPRMILALRDNPMFKNVVYVSFTIYTILLYVNFYNNWGDKSGFGNYKTVFNPRTPYSFFQRE